MSEKHHSHCLDAMEINDLQCIMRVRSILYRNIKEGVIMDAVHTNVIKRNGEEVNFDLDKIVNQCCKQRGRPVASVERLSGAGNRR